MTTSIPGTKRTEAYGGCEVHPAAELFPLLEGEEFAELVDDIKANGLLESIWRTPDGRILDGRNRYRACREVGVEPTYQVHDGDPWAFAVSRNLHRRHLTGPQRAMIAAKLAERANGSNQYMGKTTGREGSSIGTPPFEHPNQAQVAALLNTSRTSVHRARVVITKGTDGLARLVDEGRVSVHAAERVARLPAEGQADFVAAVRSGAKPRAVAPPSRRQESPTDTESAPLPKKTYYRRSEVVSRSGAFKVVTALGGFQIGLADATSVDPAITKEEAARWAGDLRQSIRCLRGLAKMLEERSK